MRLQHPVRAILTLLLAVLFVAGYGVASAVWTASGSGSGAGTTGAGPVVTLSPGTPGVTVRPGGQADVVLTVSNPNRTAVRLNSLVLDEGEGTGGFAVDPDHAGCAVSTLSYTSQTNGGAGWTVPASVGEVEGTLSIRLPNALAMSLGAANACQGARITVYLMVGR